MITDILLQKYKNIKLTELNGGYTNYTLLLEGTSPPVIAKISKNGDIDKLIEINSLKLLNYTNITPKLHDYFENNGYLYTIMDYIPGVNCQNYLDNFDSDKAHEIYKQLGQILARDIHSIKSRNSTRSLPTIKLVNIELDSLDFIPLVLMNEVRTILNINIEEEQVLIHGDYGPHNALILNESLYIIDWEWAGWGHPLQDISWILWFVHLHYPQIAKELSGTFLTTYCSYSKIQINEELIKAFSVSRIINIMDRIRNASIDVQQEWIRRLQWTMNTNFLG
ncbi:phosphotransferase family protein [Paenibacillus macquariensis]|uniref:Phosphotransferase enzyme family protein n=1 Tax=Paenibacillus macquariensis TaxID=948756 RepID=A0ABY1JMD4_9BACL|nr:aminoglycoside phosphotransferase family protein [Paenibacillus macquariensis]MEC0092330.1 aminoglycoside phosphotransferase family protein [Paenibacillus macquariensis]OAB37131.1 hypothetical protein PMSM_03370 [Paenibacillus macquariensis subsp. macquariensis]SIQ46033.1 Phosphotransferase enzyme family protein [Paenibacillus macquariensis]